MGLFCKLRRKWSVVNTAPGSQDLFHDRWRCCLNIWMKSFVFEVGKMIILFFFLSFLPLPFVLVIAHWKKINWGKLDLWWKSRKGFSAFSLMTFVPTTFIRITFVTAFLLNKQDLFKCYSFQQCLNCQIYQKTQVTFKLFDKLIFLQIAIV